MILPIAAATDPTPWMILPFALMLASIAAMPFIAPHWWEHHYPKVSIGLAAITVSYYLGVLHASGRMAHVAHEYIGFIALIGSLYIVAGGIHIGVKGRSTPAGNALFLASGAVLANIVGTTGASMLLIRPWVRMNRSRVGRFHIVFFIFIVSNVGGCLTPIGDPPLFLGFLKGVPFWWVLEHCWIAWMICLGILLAIFLALDTISYRRARAAVPPDGDAGGEWKFEGLQNTFFIAAIISAVLYNRALPPFVPEAIMAAAAAASFLTTPGRIHRANHFDFGPLREVAYLFVGIFATMVPALDYLGRHSGQLGLHSPMQFYWLTGLLSAFLDNAPTYLTFFAAAMGDRGLSLDSTADVLAFIGTDNRLLVAISLGAVFFGAMTYIGNGPNFMVKNISRQLGVHTPGFFGYVFRYAVPFLLPPLAIVALLFFSRWAIF